MSITNKQAFKRDELELELWHEDHPQVVPLKFVRLQDALAVAYAAYRINKETYLKDTRRYSELENTTTFDNKSLVKFYWDTKLGNYNAQHVPQDFAMFEPTKEDYDSAEEARKWIKRYVMLGLGNLDDFKQQMVAELNKDQVPVKGMGRIAFAPEFIKRDRNESSLTKTIRIEYRDSKHIQPVGEKVEGVVEFLDKRYSQQWESYNYTCVLEGNLVSFMNKFDHAVGDRMLVKGKVKAHTKNKLFSADETRLNYCKLYKL
jgi:hypothetical protein|tara:strand:- start:107 stop:886 length:780 start_codon:yes stop_codon:yes gene_type:complete